MAFDIKKIKALFFDIDNTLLDFNKNALWAMNRSAKDMNLTLPENAYGVFKEINDALWGQVERGEIEVKELHEVRFVRILDKLRIEADGHRFEELFFHYLGKSSEKEDGAAEMLRSLSEKYDCYVASNAAFDQQWERLRDAEFLPYFKGVFVSADIGVSKPSPLFFDACFERIGGIKPEETAFIGDSIPADIEGAYAYGIHTVWYNKERKDIVCKEAEVSFMTLREIEQFFTKG